MKHILFLVLCILTYAAVGRASDEEVPSQISETGRENYEQDGPASTSCDYSLTYYDTVLQTRKTSYTYYVKYKYTKWCWLFFQCDKYGTKARCRYSTESYYTRVMRTRTVDYTCYNGGTCNAFSKSTCDCTIGWTDDECSTGTNHTISLNYSSLTNSSAELHLQTAYHPVPPTTPHDLNYTATIRDITFQTSSTVNTRQTASNFSIHLHHLLPHRDYQIYVEAINYPTTSISNTITFRTLTAKPTSAPNGVKAIPSDTKTIIVVWSAPNMETQNGIITGYSVVYKRIDKTQEEYRTNVSVAWYDITLLEEYTEYSIKVAAINSAGIGEYTDNKIARTLEGVPTAPPQVSFVSRTSTSISLLLEPPSDRDLVNGIIRRYVVRYFGKILDTEIRDQEVVTSANHLSPKEVIISGLEEGVVYVISVNIHTSIGGGPYFHHLEVATLESAPSGPPRNVNFEMFPTSFNFNWSPPELDLQNGVITGYLVEYHGLLVDMDERNFTTDKLIVVLTGLEEGVPYELSICAKTVVGTGPCADTEIKTRDVIPGEAPDNLEVEVDGSTVLSLTWDAITKEEENGAIISYHVIVTGQGFDTSTREIYTNSSNTYYSIESLQEANLYATKVAAANSAGIGPYSNEATAVTEESSPAASPRNVFGIASSTRIVLIWEDVNPLDRNGEITQYEVHYEGTSVDRTKHHVTVGEKFLSLTGLYEGERYQFRVRAYTEEGAGPYSRIHYTTTLEIPPDLPTNVSVITISSTRIRVIWYEPLPADRNGVITGYNLWIARVDGSKGGTEIEIRELVRTYTFENLIPGTRYLVKVRARNCAPGPYSDPVYAETRPLRDV